MTLPTLFANATTATGAQLDGDFAALGALTAIPCTATGTSTLVLTPVSGNPAVTAYASYSPFTFVPSATNSGTVSAQVGTLPSLPVYKDTSGGPSPLIGGEMVTGNLCTLVYDAALNSGAGGFHFQITIASASSTTAGAGGFFRNLVIAVTGSTTVTAAADLVVMANGAATAATALSATIATGTVGLNGLDTGTLAPGWYAVWAVSNGSTTGAVLSTSFTAPGGTILSSYPYHARIGAVLASSFSFLLGMKQKGRVAQFVVGGSGLTSLPQIFGGTAGDPSVPTWLPVGIGGYTPPTAARIGLVLSSGGAAGTVIVAPNGSYGGYNSTNNGPPLATANATGVIQNISGWIVPESTNVYIASNVSGAYVSVLGWEDNL